MSTPVNIGELKNRLSEFLERAEKGDEILVCKRNGPLRDHHRTAEAEKPFPTRLGGVLIADFAIRRRPGHSGRRLEHAE